MTVQIRLLLFAIFFAVPAAASAQTIEQIVFFGDSLSDSGNHFIFTGSSSRQPFSLDPPSASYDIGGHHFSDGATWAEQLASALHVPTSGKPALRAPGVFTNYAVGQARARAGAPGFSSFDLVTQVNQYLADFGGHVPAGTLVAIWIGGNDIEDALFDPSGGAAILGEAITATIRSMSILYGAGARMFLVVNVPDFAYTPYVRYLDELFPGTAAAASTATNFYDVTLRQSLATFAGSLPSDPLQFVDLLDANALIGQIVASPATFGIANASDRCTTPGVQGGAICSTPHRYLFWDGTHPTRTGHDAVAHAALELLGAR